jgi:hypothetical protein
MVVPGDAAVLPLPAQFGLHHLAGCSSFFFILGGAPAHLGTSMFSLLTTLVCIAVFACSFKAYHARLHLDAAGNDAPPIGRPRRIRRRLSATEWAAIPFIPGTIKPCSVAVDGEMCGGPHRHINCSLLPAAKAEKARLKRRLHAEEWANRNNHGDPNAPYRAQATAPDAPVTAADPAGTVTWYAVAAGRETGIFTSWAKVEPLVSGFSGALHKSFHHSRRAETWLAEARRQLAHVRLSNAADSSAAAAEAASADLYPYWYAVAVGRKTGIFSSWADVQPLVTGFPGAKHKRFRRQFRRMAVVWLEHQEMFAEGRLVWHPDNHSRSSDFVIPVAAVVPAASDFVVPLPPAPTGGAAAVTRDDAVALDSTFTDSDTGSDSASSTGSPSSTDTIDTTVPDCALRRRRRYPTEVNGVRGLPPGLRSSHLTVLSLFTFITLRLMLRLPRQSSTTWFGRIGCSFSLSW